MALETIFTFAIVGSIVWGGLIYFLYKAISFEKNKKDNE